MLTKEQIAEALSRPTALEELHPSLRRQIDDDILDRPSQTIQSIFDQHALAARRVSRATFYRYARKLRLLQSAADFDHLLGPDGPSRAQLFSGLQNGLLYQLAEAVNAEEIEPGKIQKLAQSLKSLVTTDLALQKHASQGDAPNRTGRASAGPERAQQPATSNVSPVALQRRNLHHRVATAKPQQPQNDHLPRPTSWPAKRCGPAESDAT